jgi:hypothetical protein
LLPRKVVHVRGEADPLTSALTEVLGEPVSVAVHLGTARANRKPVLEVMSLGGRVLCWGKLGVGPLTDQLVTTESQALQTLNGRALKYLRVPEHIATMSWQGHPLLLMTALPTGRGLASLALVSAAAKEVASIMNADSSSGRALYRDRLSQRLGVLPQTTLVDAMRTGVERYLDDMVTVPFGAWHGDWSAWNMSEHGGRLSVWDWERFEWPVPHGFDELHLRFQSAVRASPQAARSHAYRLVTLRGDGQPATTEEQAAASLYLLDLASRYLHDRQAEAGNSLGRVEEWLTVVPLIKWPTSSATLSADTEGDP